jgi:adenosylmethionine---8-amino-7-oxononanoate aminotransferase
MNRHEKEQLIDWDRRHVWHPFTPMQAYLEEPPLVVSEARGCLLIDVDGREYVDGVSSLWCNVHGHRVPQIDQAVREQLDRVAHSTLLGLASVPSIRLAKRLVDLAPPGLTRVFFSDDGATAVEVALKMAFQYWRQCPTPRPKKTRFLSLSNAYHGDTLGDVSVGDVGRFHQTFEPLLFRPIKAPSPYCYRCPLGLERATCKIDCAEEVVRLIRQNADELAAVVMEPLVQGAAGIITAPEGYLRRVREVTRECGVLLIADEVAVGFGRTGSLFACSQEDVSPDFLCVAKGLTGGYLPVAATLTTEPVYEAFLGPPEAGRTFYHGHTYTGNALGCAAALANLELMTGPGGMDAVPAKAERLRGLLQRLREIPLVGDVRQRGLMAGVELVKDRHTKEAFPAALRLGHRVCLRMRDKGVILRPLGDVVVVMPPLAIDDASLDRIGAALYETLREVASS